MNSFLKAKLNCTDNCRIGDYIVVSFDIEGLKDGLIESDITYKVNELSDNGLLLSKAPYINKNSAVFEFVSYKEGVFKIEPFKIKIKETEYLTQSFEFKVLGITKELQLNDIVPPQKIYPSTFYYLGVVSVVLIFILLIYFLFKKFRKSKEIIKTIYISPYEEALSKLSKLEFDKNLSLKKMVSSVTEIIKKFISDEYSIDILDKTSTESYLFLKENNIFELEKTNMLKSFFTEADLIKFKEQYVLNKQIDFINETRKLLYSLRKAELKNEI